ncbi:MAG: FtsZ/tubulin family protein [Nitrososphaerales archaeon]
MLDQDRKLTDYPYSTPGYGRRIAVVGVGSAGCKIANQLSKESKLLEHFVYVTCDDHDLVPISNGDRILVGVSSSGKMSPSSVRGRARFHMPQIKQDLKDSEIVFVLSGLGGMVGSGLAPIIVKEARERGAVAVAILVMPHNFEKSKHFFASVALKQIRSFASGIIIIDNDELHRDVPIIDAYADINHKIALSLNKLLGSAEEHEFSIGLNNVVEFVKTNSYSVLCVGEQFPEYKEAVMSAVRHFGSTVDKTQAAKSLVHLCTDKSITMNDLVSSLGGLSAVLGNGTMQIEYGLSANSATRVASAIIIATGFSNTKFDRYDPVEYLLESKFGNIDCEMDESIEMESLLPNVEVI